MKKCAEVPKKFFVKLTELLEYFKMKYSFFHIVRSPMLKIEVLLGLFSGFCRIAKLGILKIQLNGQFLMKFQASTLIRQVFFRPFRKNSLNITKLNTFLPTMWPKKPNFTLFRGKIRPPDPKISDPHNFFQKMFQTKSFGGFLSWVHTNTWQHEF